MTRRQIPDDACVDALANGTCRDPFSILGMHRVGTGRVVRSFQPQAESVTLIDADGHTLVGMRRVHDGGLFEASMPARKRRYRLRIEPRVGITYEIEDPYRFPSGLGELDLHLLGEGSHQRIYETLGAHCIELLGVAGTRFAVWAPNATRVSVIGSFNDWDGRRNVMRLHPGSGIWEIFIPGIGHREFYRFELLDSQGRLLPLKTDPLAHYYEAPPGNAAIVYQSSYRWTDSEWMATRKPDPRLDEPMSIYEVHLGSWRRRPEDGNRPLSYRELADELVGYVTEMGFTHIELLPVTEHPFYGSWGYQPIGMYAPTQRFGEPDDFRYFVDCCHRSGIGVIIDWVPAHFPRDAHGLARFDGTSLYEHEDPRKGEHVDWATLIFNYDRHEVVNYLIGSAIYWIDKFHIDGLRVDAVASMLYLDYSREEGEWLPNEQGGNEHFEAIEFLRRLNEEIHQRNAISLAEESTSWPGVSHPVHSGGLGFTYKWNMGWMNDSLAYMQEDAINRKHHHDKITFGPYYASTENFVLPLSHDEVVHCKRSLLGRMPGDEWQRFANLRAFFTMMYCHPGKKLLFMGAEIAQLDEWDHDSSLDWHLLRHPPHTGVQTLVRDLNQLYRGTPALYQVDFDHRGFEWIDWQDSDNSVFSWIRRALDDDFLVCVANFTPVIRYDYRVGVPELSRYRELLNSDSPSYGGSGAARFDTVESEPVPCHDRDCSLKLTLPPLATLIIGRSR